MIRVLGRFQADAAARDGVKAALADVRTGSLEEDGCLGFRLFEDRNDPNLFFVEECFADEAAVGFHRTQPYEVAFSELAETALAAPAQAFVLGEAISGDTSGQVARAATADELVAIGVFDFKPGARAAIVAQYQKQIPNVRAATSCVAFNAYPVIEQPTQLIVIEWWTSPAEARQFSTTDPLSVETGQLLMASLDRPFPEYLHELQEVTSE